MCIFDIGNDYHLLRFLQWHNIFFTPKYWETGREKVRCDDIRLNVSRNVCIGGNSTLVKIQIGYRIKVTIWLSLYH